MWTSERAFLETSRHSNAIAIGCTVMRGIVHRECVGFFEKLVLTRTVLAPEVNVVNVTDELYGSHALLRLALF